MEESGCGLSYNSSVDWSDFSLNVNVPLTGYNHSSGVEIKRRTAMAAGQLKKMEKIWKGQDKQTKLKIVRACIFHGCEGWTLTTADEKKINAFETKCYRRILRIPWIAKRKKTQKS